MFQRILVPLDGSKRSERAIPLAAHIVRAGNGTIVFVYVVLPPVEFGTYSAERTVSLKPGAFEAREAEATSYLSGILLTHANELGAIKTEMDVTAGAAAQEIYAAARLEAVDLVILCSHGETGLRRWVFGSMAQEVVRHSPVPALVLQEHSTPRPGRALHMLVPLDGSALSETALLPAAQLIALLAGPAQGTLHLLRVVDLPPAYGKMRSQANVTKGMEEEARQEAQQYVQSVAERLRAELPAALNLSITSSVTINTDVAGAIIAAAERPCSTESSGGADVIALATHGRGGLRRLVIGSVTEHILGATKLPLLVVRPQQANAENDERPEEAAPS